MPYAVLVSALGAIISTAIALFGLHSLAALKFAPVAGALVGFLFAIFSLRLNDLPLRSTLEDYRSLAGVSQDQRRYLNSALRVGLIVSFIELPSVLLRQDVTLPICVVGWLGVLGGTLYQGWRVSGPPGKLDVFQIIGGIACLLIFGSLMYVFALEIRPGLQNLSILYLVRVIFILNGFAAFVSAVLALFGLAIASNIGARPALRR
jgi:hypothetical protein